MPDVVHDLAADEVLNRDLSDATFRLEQQEYAFAVAPKTCVAFEVNSEACLGIVGSLKKKEVQYEESCKLKVLEL